MSRTACRTPCKPLNDTLQVVSHLNNNLKECLNKRDNLDWVKRMAVGIGRPENVKLRNSTLPLGLSIINRWLRYRRKRRDKVILGCKLKLLVNRLHSLRPKLSPSPSKPVKLNPGTNSRSSVTKSRPRVNFLVIVPLLSLSKTLRPTQTNTSQKSESRQLNLHLSLRQKPKSLTQKLGRSTMPHLPLIRLNILNPSNQLNTNLLRIVRTAL